MLSIRPRRNDTKARPTTQDIDAGVACDTCGFGPEGSIVRDETWITHTKRSLERIGLNAESVMYTVLDVSKGTYEDGHVRHNADVMQNRIATTPRQMHMLCNELSFCAWAYEGLSASIGDKEETWDTCVCRLTYVLK
jgi:hypothetical protein